MSKTIEIRDRKGKTITGDLYLPVKKQDKYPLVLMIRMVGGSQKQSAAIGMANKLIKGGIAAFCLDLTDESAEGAERATGILANSLENIEDVLDYFCKQDFVDKKRIGILGCGFGGTKALMIASKMDTIKTVISLGALGSMEEERKFFFSEVINDPNRKFMEFLSRHGQSFKIPVGLINDFMLTDFMGMVAKIKCPVCVMHSIGDDVIAYKEAVSIYEALACKVKKLESLPHDIPHEPREKEHVEIIGGLVAGWLNKYL